MKIGVAIGMVAILCSLISMVSATETAEYSAVVDMAKVGSYGARNADIFHVFVEENNWSTHGVKMTFNNDSIQFFQWSDTAGDILKCQINTTGTTIRIQNPIVNDYPWPEVKGWKNGKEVKFLSSTGKPGARIWLVDTYIHVSLDGKGNATLRFTSLNPC